MDKQDLINAIRGTQPSYESMDHPLVKLAGLYIGGFKDDWHWDTHILKKMDIDDLTTIYKLVKADSSPF